MEPVTTNFEEDTVLAAGLTGVDPAADEASHPLAVLADPGRSESQKRAVLAAWASDANAVESQPGLRRRPGSRAAAVPVGAVLDALRRLDGDGAGGAPSPPPLPPLRRPLPARFGARRILH